jgi:hypothetical protein
MRPEILDLFTVRVLKSTLGSIFLSFRDPTYAEEFHSITRGPEFRDWSFEVRIKFPRPSDCSIAKAHQELRLRDYQLSIHGQGLHFPL